jgi:hypothetical protein
MKMTLAICGAAALSGCAIPVCTLKNSLTVTSSHNTLTIVGTGFSANTNQCAQLSMFGVTPSQVIGTVTNCSGGNFKITLTPQYIPGCNANQSTSVQVIADDTQQQTCLASASTTILWGNNCSFQGNCGKIGQKACPGNTACYVSGGVDGYGNCVTCGNQGQPPCTNASGTDYTGCFHGLLPQNAGGFSGNPFVLQPPVICTALCGYAQGAQEPCSIQGVSNPNCSGGPPQLIQPQNACVTSTTVAGNPNPVPVYTCYGDSVTGEAAQLDAYGQGICVPNLNVPVCQGSSSGLSGLPQNAPSSPPVDFNCTQ